MSVRISKKRKTAQSKFDSEKSYTFADAAKIVKDITYTKFDSSVDISIRLGVDPKNTTQMVRGVVSLPHGSGKTVRVIVLCTPDKEKEAKEAGADYAGLDEFLTKIEKGWVDFDVVITMPAVMAKVGKLGKVLGPRNLMPNPKTGTVTNDVAKAVKEVKAGKIDFKMDKQGIIHASVGKVSFDPSHLADNANEVLQSIVKLKPASAKGTYIKSVSMSSTMSPGVKIDTREFTA